MKKQPRKLSLSYTPDNTPGIWNENEDHFEKNFKQHRDELNEYLKESLLALITKNEESLGRAADALTRWANEDAALEAFDRWWADKGDNEQIDTVEARLVQAAKDCELSIDRPNKNNTIAFELLDYGTSGNSLCLIFTYPEKDENTPEVQNIFKRYLESLQPGTKTEPEPWLGIGALQAAFIGYHWDVINFFCVPPQRTEENDWMKPLVLPWLNDRATIETERLQAETERLEREANARALEHAPAILIKGREYGRLPKVAAGISWAFGGPGSLAKVVIDGNEYAPAPDLSIMPAGAILPAGFSLLPADHKERPHQAILPLDTTGDDDAPPLPVALADATQYAIKPAAGKLGLVILAASWAAGTTQKSTIRELTQRINPDARLAASHFQTVLKGLQELDALRLVLPNGIAYRVFECPTAWRELTPDEYDTPIYAGMTRTFEQTLDAIQDAAGKSYKGDFLFDLTGAMKLKTMQTGLIRQYIRACAFWNSYWKPGGKGASKGEPCLDRIPEVDAKRWAAMTNYLPPAAVEYVRAKNGDRRRLSEALNKTITEAEQLEGAGLVKIARADRKAIKLLPPPIYLEAWHESRKGAHRMPRK